MKLKHATLILLWLSAAAVVVFAATPTKPSSETAASGKESAGPARSFPKSAFEYAKMAEPEFEKTQNSNHLIYSKRSGR